MVSDASGSLGCHAFCLPHWFNLQWSVNMQTIPIAVKELFPVVIAAAIYGNQWLGKLVLFRVNNMAVVEVLKATYGREPHLMYLIRMLVFFAAHFNFWFSASHVAGSKKYATYVADSLSCNNAKYVIISVTGLSGLILPFKDSSSTNQTTGMQPYMDYHSLDAAVQGHFAAAFFT